MYAIWPKIILGWDWQRRAQVRTRTVEEETTDTLIQTFARRRSRTENLQKECIHKRKTGVHYSIVLELYCPNERIDN